jgi:hypothetical protein
VIDDQRCIRFRRRDPAQELIVGTSRSICSSNSRDDGLGRCVSTVARHGATSMRRRRFSASSQSSPSDGYDDSRMDVCGLAFSSAAARHVASGN